MKFSNGTEFRFGTPKYSKVMVRLFGVGGVFGIIAWFIGAPAKDWVGGIGMLGLAAGLVVFLAGTIAERKEFKLKRKSETK